MFSESRLLLPSSHCCCRTSSPRTSLGPQIADGEEPRPGLLSNGDHRPGQPGFSQKTTPSRVKRLRVPFQVGKHPYSQKEGSLGPAGAAVLPGSRRGEMEVRFWPGLRSVPGP